MTNKELNKMFGDRLTALRRNRAMTQEDLAEVTRISVEFISLLERGSRGVTLATMVKLAKGLGISLAELINFDEEFDWQKTLKKGGGS